VLLDKARAVQLALRATAGLPLPCLAAIGTVIGWLLWLFPNKQKHIAAVNLQLCFPTLSNKQRRVLLRRSLCHNVQAILELGPLWLWPSDRVLQLVRESRNENLWRDCLNSGQGAIVLTPHLGAWELAGLYVSHHYPLTSLYRPSRFGSSFDHQVKQARERLGGTLVPTDARGVKHLLQAVRNGAAAGILPDQDPGPENGLFAPFFGQPANTMSLLSRLAIRCNVPVFIAYAERLPYGRGFRLHFQALPESLQQPPLERSIAVLNEAIERVIRQQPEQYLWTYKRFKTRPPGLSKVY
jgi:KDO2-lipid IV(A) lauroyltransferase